MLNLLGNSILIGNDRVCFQIYSYVFGIETIFIQHKRSHTHTKQNSHRNSKYFVTTILLFTDYKTSKLYNEKKMLSRIFFILKISLISETWWLCRWLREVKLRTNYLFLYNSLFGRCIFLRIYRMCRPIYGQKKQQQWVKDKTIYMQVCETNFMLLVLWQLRRPCLH